jgi:Dullard-like phosphatase family protein
MLLVLDLDETLIYASEQELEGLAWDFRASGYYVYKRPHVDEFLSYCARSFEEVAVWTSASRGYALQVVARLFGADYPLSWVWASERCTRRFDPERMAYDWVKDLRKIKRKGYDLRQVIGVDDTPQKYERSYGNLVRVSMFEGDQGDDELLALMAYLEELRRVEDVRAVEKRRWRLR